MYCSSKVVPEFSCKAKFLCTPPPPQFCWGEGEVEPPTKFSKRGDLKGSQFLNEIAGIEGGDFFQGLLQFLHKKCLKSEIFNDKKSL